MLRPEFYVGIDPGPDYVSVAVTNSDGVPHEVSSGTIRGAGGRELFCFFCKRLPVLLKSTVTIEDIQPYGERVSKSTIETCVMIGRCLQFLDSCGTSGYRIGRHRIGSLIGAKAGDKKFRARLIELLGHPGTAKRPGPTHGIVGDAWSALAVATAMRLALKRDVMPDDPFFKKVTKRRAAKEALVADMGNAGTFPVNRWEVWEQLKNKDYDLIGKR